MQSLIEEAAAMDWYVQALAVEKDQAARAIIGRWRMCFAKGADVFTATGEKIGTLQRVVIAAKTRDVIDRGMLSSEKVIPVGLVDTEKEDKIRLRETHQGVDGFLDYETTHFVVGKGLLLKEPKLVPALWIAKVAEAKIYLSVEARLFERLPDYQPD